VAEFPGWTRRTNVPQSPAAFSRIVLGMALKRNPSICLELKAVVAFTSSTVLRHVGAVETRPDVLCATRKDTVKLGTAFKCQREHSEMKALGYTWRVLINFFYLLVVGAVLTSISNPSEKQIIAVLGLVYVTIRTQAIFQGIGTSTIVADFQKQIDQIRYFVDGNFELPNRDRQIALLEARQAKLFIDAFFLSVISLACLVAFFAAQ
jgi:hypothetical protein